MATIHHRREHARGCGFRKPGGTYLVGGGLMAPCGRLPLPCEVCPTCGQGIKPSRGWAWVDGDKLKTLATRTCDSDQCAACPMSDSYELGRVGLLWVGSKFYPDVDAFANEAKEMGISRRIAQVPRDFVVGETWVFLAHRQAIQSRCECNGSLGTECADCEGTLVVSTPGIFSAFKPERIEYVVKGDESEEELDRKERQGFTLVSVEPVGQASLLQ